MGGQRRRARADRFYVDLNPDNRPKLDREKGVLLALDEFGNVSTYVDVHVKSYVPDEGADPRIANPNHFISERRTNGHDPDSTVRPRRLQNGAEAAHVMF